MSSRNALNISAFISGKTELLPSADESIQFYHLHDFFFVFPGHFDSILAVRAN